MNMKTTTLLFPMPHRPWTQNDCIREYFHKICSLVLYILHICCYLPICTIVCCIFICFKGWAVLCVVYVLFSCMKSLSSWFCEFTSSCRDGTIPCKQCEETNTETNTERHRHLLAPITPGINKCTASGYVILRVTSDPWVFAFTPGIKMPSCAHILIRSLNMQII